MTLRTKSSWTRVLLLAALIGCALLSAVPTLAYPWYTYARPYHPVVGVYVYTAPYYPYATPVYWKPSAYSWPRYYTYPITYRTYYRTYYRPTYYYTYTPPPYYRYRYVRAGLIPVGFWW
ncbi:hypothetical protein D6783_06005 [Candidatus Woesearchaeota archaeon]|nr:MAG: hypothetical protein D6783_06005 [Candidatus Woesearchaeota archaeon]